MKPSKNASRLTNGMYSWFEDLFAFSGIKLPNSACDLGFDGEKIGLKFRDSNQIIGFGTRDRIEDFGEEDPRISFSIVAAGLGDRFKENVREDLISRFISKSKKERRIYRGYFGEPIGSPKTHLMIRYSKVKYDEDSYSGTSIIVPLKRVYSGENGGLSGKFFRAVRNEFIRPLQGISEGAYIGND